ncbi:TPA: hypothetical protein DEB00_03090 [Candidatus Uhrbacteria bacterium]|nr:hypothetical protein [Candidatus Uhrbacteria bacterium]
MTYQTKPWFIVLVIGIVAVVVAGGIYLWQTQYSTIAAEGDQNTKTYTSSEFKYSFAYPADWFLKAINMGEAQPEVVRISKQEIQDGSEPDVEFSINITRSTLEDAIGNNLKIPEDMIFAGHSAKTFNYSRDFSDPAVSLVYVPVNNFTFVLSYNPEDQDIAGIETILQSFAFTSDQVTSNNNTDASNLYTNDVYGFTLMFPQTWEGYTTKSRTIRWGAVGNNDSVDFGFAAQDDLFNVSFHPKSQWAALQSEEGPIPTYLGESNTYVFTYATGQYAANDVMIARMGEVKDIMKTFTLQPTDKTDAPVTQKSLEGYFVERKAFERSDMTKNPNEYGFKELANVPVTCPDSMGTPCAGNLLVLSLDYGAQEFYLGFTMGTGYTYYGPFTDDLQKIVDQAKATESLERTY